MRKTIILFTTLILVIILNSGCGLLQFANFVFTHEPKWAYEDKILVPPEGLLLVHGKKNSEDINEKNSWWGYHVLRCITWDQVTDTKLHGGVCWKVLIDYRQAPRVIVMGELEKIIGYPEASLCCLTCMGCYQWTVTSPSGKNFIVKAERIPGTTENYKVTVSEN